MKVQRFDTARGLYHFEITDLSAEIHSHPVFEVIKVNEGTVLLEVDGKRFGDVSFAILAPNVRHRIFSESSKVELFMAESNNPLLIDFLISNHIILNDGAYISNNGQIKNRQFSEIIKFSTDVNLKSPADARIERCINFMEEYSPSYKDLLTNLSAETHLSESRLSHLFKEHIGVSLKKYLVWVKLRTAIDLFLSRKHNLTDVSLKSGFYDQAHLTRSFKNILGVSPSAVYNSRILQL